MRSAAVTVVVLALCVSAGHALGLRAPNSVDKMNELSSNIDRKLAQLSQLLDRSEATDAKQQEKLGAAARFKSLSQQKKKTSPLAAESALKANEGPSDRVDVSKLEITPEKTPAETPEVNAPVGEVQNTAQAAPAQRFKRSQSTVDARKAPAAAAAQQDSRFASTESKFVDQYDAPVPFAQKVTPTPTQMQAQQVEQQQLQAKAAPRAFYPPPITQAEQERPEDDMSNMYLNPNKDTKNGGNDIWSDGDAMARRLSEPNQMLPHLQAGRQEDAARSMAQWAQ